MNENQQNKWQALVETKRFEELSESEKQWVNFVASESIYRKEYAILFNLKELSEDVEPRLLVLSEEKKARVVPLYMPFLAAAASFVLAFFLFRSSGIDSIETGLNNATLVADTVYLEKTMVDTILETQTQYVYINQTETTSASQSTMSDCTPQPVVMTSQSAFQTDLSDAALSNKGVSARKDKSMDFIANWMENQR